MSREPSIDREGVLKRFGELCRKNRIPLTVQRRAILSALLPHKDHPTADAIYEEIRKDLPSVSRTTVYRVLETIVDLGLANKVSHPGSAVRFDPITERHHHLVCRRCDRVVDLEASSLKPAAIPAGKRQGFMIDDYSIYFRGLCAECQKTKKNKEAL